ncbi:hypothetical protein ASE01_19025 [Nocardioides sp. Root190]|uniref:M4 family metallopeptidase n=1 Tax=Nocardioides sp. Root190 TaxID=1736488 RepID=UPI0007012FEF|nr:M4 family metallopeptidase [Nocardioides sp. Root190]KRB74083.1 hypothetical protein ASE01_19025 [Nocardioides sp. Root190]
MRRVLALACASALSVSLLAQSPSGSAAPDPDDGERLLRSDADGPLRIERSGADTTFVGTPVGTDVDNPTVSRGTSVSAAARAHLTRYGGAVEADRSGTGLVETGSSEGAGGGDVVRYRQEIAGVPVLGAEVVVSVGADRELTSLNANLSRSAGVRPAAVTESMARDVAEGVLRRSGISDVRAADQGRWILDPAAVGLDPAIGVRGVWRFEVRSGDHVRRLVLVDDRSGDVVLDIDLIQGIDRIVCDQANVRTNVVACSSAAAVRTEAPGGSSTADVEAAFQNAGAVSDFYREVIGLDLTTAIGLPSAQGRKLASTVRVCVTGPDSCPYDNAFWNGQAMFYGEGYAAADDVVGHEMTHGVIERTSGLLYWDEAGAINESLADIVGELVDHRNAGPGDSPTDWQLGEDLPGGALRDMADPTLHHQPDRMTSPRWAADPSYEDSGGVHTNSGVGNRAFQLISQGGTFNGRTVTGIDAGDPTLLKSATLWLHTMAAITAFTEYADLANVLDQTCTALIGHRGFTASNCTAVRYAVAATEMALPPATDPVKDAPRTCPAGSHPRTLLDSESGADQASLFGPAAGWGRTPETVVNSAYGVSAYSGDTAWVAADPATPVTRALLSAAPVVVPEGQSTYLAFRHWHLFDFSIDPSNGVGYWWDGGTAEMTAVDGTVYPLWDHPWDFGPTRTLQAPNAGRRAFGGSSRGWVGSRVDITAFGGMSVRPTFTMRTDSSYGAPGWYLDDILVYTCDRTLAVDVAPVLPDAAPHVGLPLTVSEPTWNLPGATTSHQWRRNGVPLAGMTQATYTPVPADVGTRLSVVVTGKLDDQVVPLVVTASADVETDAVPLTIVSAPTLPATAPRVGKVYAVTAPIWNDPGTITTYQWRRDGVAIAGRTLRTYTPVAADAGRRLSVVVTGILADQSVQLTATSGIVARGLLVAPKTAGLSGTPRVGRRLAAVRGTWAPSPITYSYRWFRGSKAITGATGSSYLLRKGDKGFRISVRITGSKSGYTAVTRTSGSVLVRR